MQATPTISSHQWPVTSTATRPASAETAKQAKAARLTADGLAAPEPTSRWGPTRFSSEPRTPSE